MESEENKHKKEESKESNLSTFKINESFNLLDDNLDELLKDVEIDEISEENLLSNLSYEHLNKEIDEI